jgi:hypothetical protein
MRLRCCLRRPPNSDGTDINAVQRSRDGRVVATADDFGGVCLLNCPCITANAPKRRYSGHSEFVCWSSGAVCAIALRHTRCNERSSAAVSARETHACLCNVLLWIKCLQRPVHT